MNRFHPLTVVWVVFVAATLGGCTGPSKETIAKVRDQCVTFQKENRRSAGSSVEAVDHWMKNNSLVVELAVRDSDRQNTYTPYLCVYDVEKGVIALPALFNQDRWSK